MIGVLGQPITGLDIEIVKRRLNLLPLTTDEISDLYGFEKSTAFDLNASSRGEHTGEFIHLWDRQEISISVGSCITPHHENWQEIMRSTRRTLVCMVFTFSSMSVNQCARSVAEQLAGADARLAVQCYTSTGINTHISLHSMPTDVGTFATVQSGTVFVFRLPAEGYSEAWERGEAVPTMLWQCSEEAFALLDSCTTYEAHANWRAKHCRPYIDAGGQTHSIIHAECTVALTPHIIHRVALRDECSVIFNPSRTIRFK